MKPIDDRLKICTDIKTKCMYCIAILEEIKNWNLKTFSRRLKTYSTGMITPVLAYCNTFMAKTGVDWNLKPT